jgi:plastocyanin
LTNLLSSKDDLRTIHKSIHSLAMLFTTFSLGLALLPFAAAQQIHTVQVGSSNGTLAFSPEAISAQAGDQVVFNFYPKNHSVTQSSFAGPCSFKEGGFDSGFMPVAANVTETIPTYSITINDTQPVWVYCAQAANTAASHCGAGMVFAVNCGPDGSNNSFTDFKNAALQIGASLSAAASSTAAGAYSTAPSSVATAAYGGVTIAPAPTPSVVTEAVTLSSSTWTTVYSSYPNSPAPTPASLQGNVITVVVGGTDKLFFDPAHVTAEPRDTIVFQFQQKNHSVVQSSFADPCRPLTNSSVTGFMTDFFPVADNSTDFPTWNLTVNDTAPIWAYCRQKTPSSHCGAGMVFAINSDETSARNFTAFQDLAEQLNGTATGASATGASSSPSPSHTSAAAPFMRISSVAGVTVVLGAVLASL